LEMHRLGVPVRRPHDTRSPSFGLLNIRQNQAVGTM
jgi:hypothetical protein